MIRRKIQLKKEHISNLKLAFLVAPDQLPSIIQTNIQSKLKHIEPEVLETYQTLYKIFDMRNLKEISLNNLKSSHKHSLKINLLDSHIEILAGLGIIKITRDENNHKLLTLL